MRLKQCKRCGKQFQAEATWIYLCQDCAAAAQKASVVRPRICQECGAEFPGGPRAWYCPQCRAERRRAADRDYKRRGKAARPIGSTDICAACGKQYTVMGGRQMYCPDCAPSVLRQKEREHKREHYRQNREYYAAHKREVSMDAKICVVCGRPFSGRGPSVTCSQECADAHRKAQQLASDIKRGRRKPRL